ncbi:MAG TPA: hypothetical protein ENK25_05720 [Bacteroidetes bacterium]|nr:hypothetical protein [Bacteroidota bacterium]
MAELTSQKSRVNSVHILPQTAGNILVSLLPVFSGMFIVLFGYKAVFLTLAGLILAGLFFAAKLNCSPVKKK